MTRFDPNAAARAKNQRVKEAGRFSVSPGLIIGVGAAVLAIVLISLFLAGPKRVWAQWEAIGDKARYDVIDVVSRGLQAHLSQTGEYNPRKGRNTPQAKDVMFFRPSFVMSMPETVDFKGSSSEGPFKGKYHPKTGEVEADVDVGGASIEGLGAVRKGNATLKVTGRVKSGNITAEVNGKNAVIVMPPVDELEESRPGQRR